MTGNPGKNKHEEMRTLNNSVIKMVSFGATAFQLTIFLQESDTFLVNWNTHTTRLCNSSLVSLIASIVMFFP